MKTPLGLLRFIARAGLAALGGGAVGDFAAEVLPDLAREVWGWWGKGRREPDLQAEVQALARLGPDDARSLADQIVLELAADRPPEVRLVLATSLAQVPATIRRSQRSPADPSGRTTERPPPLEGPLDLLPFLPSRPPRFRPGDRPTGIGDWELEELLGVGGFGEVWKARNANLPDPVALKFCLDPQTAEVLRNEASLLGRVMSQGRHPGIVRLLHTYLKANPPCLEYEYVPGGDLAGLLARWHRDPPPTLGEDAARLMHELAGIVAFAHRLEPPIVHRDLKPANVLLEPRDGGGFALRVADFGIGGLSHDVDLPGTRSTTRGPMLLTMLRCAHTPLYASLQQRLGEPPHPRDDVYSLGVIWYQLLTGHRAIVGVPADWRDELAERGVPEAAVRLLGACLASQPGRRPADAGVLAEALAGLLSPATVVETSPAGPPAVELAEQVRRSLRRVEQAHAEARRLVEQHHDYAAAVRLLEQAPAHLRDGALYADLCSRRDRVVELDARVRRAVESMHFAGLRPHVEELLRLAPGREDLRRLLEALPPDVPPPAQRTNSLGMRLVLVPAGTFLMGSPRHEAERRGNEPLPHAVTIARAFYLGAFPVTQHEYEVVMGRNPSCFCAANRGGPTHPVEQVTWLDVIEFCRRLLALPGEQTARWAYRLPAEAEWEYACRAGTTMPFSFGAAASSAEANFNGSQPYGGAAKGDYGARTSPVGSYAPNAWGLYDMHGNVWEWCADSYDGAEEGRVVRGGCWFSEGGLCRAACRLRRRADDRDFNIGFRVALDVDPTGLTP
jgi:formylglycine-generating enzyme required for sulfatase activity